MHMHRTMGTGVDFRASEVRNYRYSQDFGKRYKVGKNFLGIWYQVGHT